MKIITSSIASILAFILLTFLLGGWGTIPAGHRGVVTRMGAVTGEVKPEGFYTKTPFLESVKEMDIRQQKEQVSTEGASKDLQTVHAVVALNVMLLPTKCAEVYQTIGVDYLEKIIAPTMQEGIKAVLAQYTAEELISKRELVRQSISTHIAEKLTPYGIKTEALNIVNFDFSKSFNLAIENKVTAEQNALASKNLLAQKEYEAQQAVATARGKAESIKIESAALSESPQILQLRALEKWDGQLPKVVSGAIPFIEIKGFAEEKTAK